MREFEKHGISMPDDARELIFPQGIVVHQQTMPHHTDTTENNLINKPKELIQKDTQQDLRDNEHNEDLASDADDIRQQAKEARDPEKGQNIL